MGQPAPARRLPCYQSFIDSIGRSPEATISGCGQWLGSHPHIWGWVNTYRYIFSGMNIHLPAILGFTRYQGFDPSPFNLFIYLYLCWPRISLCFLGLLLVPTWHPTPDPGCWRQALTWHEPKGDAATVV